MGSNTSKTSTQTTVSQINKDENATNMMGNILLDPRSPDVNRTPLVSILGSRMKAVEQTPISRKSLLNTSNERKLLDPRSPSQFIPRTPLNISSLDGTGIENSIGKYSLEYSGYIEEASCRNFNERLANITFDDSYTEVKCASKMTEKKSKNIINLSVSRTVDASDDDVELLPLEHDAESVESVKLCQNTPSLDGPKSQFVYKDVENISPVIDTNQQNKRNAVSAFSSTPISTLNIQQKSLSINKLAKTNKEIFIDEKTNNGTPGKRTIKTKEPRTPFGCLQNQQQLTQKENENSTPKTKPTAISKRAKSRIINQMICD